MPKLSIQKMYVKNNIHKKWVIEMDDYPVRSIGPKFNPLIALFCRTIEASIPSIPFKGSNVLWYTRMLTIADVAKDMGSSWSKGSIERTIEKIEELRKFYERN